MDAVQQGVCSLPTQIETPIRTMHPCNIGHQIDSAVLCASDMLKPARLHNHRRQVTEEIRHHRLFTWMVDKFQVICAQKLKPKNLTQ